MAWPTIFANLAGGTQQLAIFDAMFNQVAQMVAIPCAAAGTNTLTLTPIGNAPVITGYQNFSSFRFLAANSSNAAVNAQFASLALLPVYLADMATQVTGQIVGGEEYVLIFVQSLNAGGGGFVLEQSAIPAIVPVAGSAFTNLVNTNNPGTPNTQINTSYDELVMNNPSGGAIRATSQSFTINAANIGVVNGLDAGALAANTWYGLWGISNGSISGGLLSTSFSAPTMPGGYTFKKRIGAFLTDGSSHFYQVMQRGNRAQFIVGTNPALTLTPISGVFGTFSAQSPVLTSVSLSSFIPPTAKSTKLMGNSIRSGTLGSLMVAPNTAWGGTQNGPGGSNGNTYPLYLQGVGTSSPDTTTDLLLEASAAFAYTGSSAGACVAIIGWEDNLG
jgi:hypothetical protein